ncbi:MAG: DUF1566 domain-containing protein [Treponema sp.]|jgi:hypothetical protein|nr:DUF1566 domain-containing protein [Treponema sp.]
MKNRVLGLEVLLLALSGMGFGQELPRLAVVEFSVNMNTPKANRDSVTVRNLVESQMVAAGKYEVITRTDIDQLLANQQIQVSSIASPENIRKLQLQNISYIVTGSVDAMDEDYAVTVKILDVSTGRFSHSANDFMGGTSRELYTGVNTLIANFVKGMAAEGGQVVQTAQAGQQTGVITYQVGNFGPAGGRVFYDKGIFSAGWRYLEAAPVETEFTAIQWGAYGKTVGGTGTAIGSGKRNTQMIVEFLQRQGETGRAAQVCAALDFDGFKDWFLPSKDELDLIYKNLKVKGLGELSDSWYWSSSEDTNNFGAWVQRFSGGSQGVSDKIGTHSVRAVRAF